jgi:manganese oxidase
MMMRPWEIHPKLVAFPLAFLLGGVVVDLYAVARGRPALRRAATSLLRAGVWLGVLAAAAGVLAFLTVPAHTEHAHTLMHWHIAGMATALVLFAFVVRARRRAFDGIPGKVATITGVAGALLVAGAAHLGGLMVLRGGAGVDPAVLAPHVREGHQHGGDHGGDAHAEAKAETGHEHAHADPPSPAKAEEHAVGEHAHGEGNELREPQQPAARERTDPPPHAHGEQEPRPSPPAQPQDQPRSEPGAAHRHDTKEPAPAPKQSDQPAAPPTKKQDESHQNEHGEHQPAQKPESADAAAPRATPEARPRIVIPPEGLPPGEPGKDYMPVVVPDGTLLPWHIVDGTKVFHLIAEPVEHEFAPGLTAKCWGYNGSVHGPTIEAVEGDRVRIYVTNRLPAPTSVHWHGILLPNGMDGVAGLNQAAIKPGETFRYEFVLRQHGTHMYHSHHDEMTQMAMGLMGLFVIHPRTPPDPPIDRDFAILLSEWRIEPGTSRPDPNEMTDFNVVTLNGRVFPGTAPLVAKLGERVRIRFGNLSAMDHHPMHLHGYQFRVVESDGGQIATSAQQVETTVLVQVGSTKTIEFVADAAGDWALHCHMTHHVMNQMGHGIPNLLGVDMAGLEEKMQALLPGYMTMGQTGMGEMATMRMPVPVNSIPMRGAEGPFDPITMGGMFTVFKVREGITSYDDPGWFQHPEGTVARPAKPDELRADGIDASGAPVPGQPSQPAHKHGGH